MAGRVQREGSLLAPIEELPDGQGVGHPSVLVADVRGEELDEAFAGVGRRRDRDRQRLEARVNKRGWCRDHIGIGQHYGSLWLFKHRIRSLLAYPLLSIITDVICSIVMLFNTIRGHCLHLVHKRPTMN